MPAGRHIILILLIICISPLPKAAAASSLQLISTRQAIDLLDRQTAELTITKQLERDEITEELLKYGVTKEMVETRMASLSDAEISDLASQMQQAQYGGITSILVVVVLVLLIIYLAKRI